MPISDRSDLILARDEVSMLLLKARRVLNELYVLKRELSRARSSGLIDMLTIGPISKLRKHRHLDQVTVAISQARKSLESYEYAVAAIRPEWHLDSHIPLAIITLDRFVGNFFFGWAIQRKIRKLERQTAKLVTIFEGEVAGLENREMELDVEIKN